MVIYKSLHVEVDGLLIHLGLWVEIGKGNELSFCSYLINLQNDFQKLISLQFHKDNLQHLPQFPDFFVTFRILSTMNGLQPGHNI